jgi:hypothetical protein
VEYRDGFAACTDCGVPLAEGRTPVPVEDVPTPDAELVTVFTCYDPVALAWAESTLSEAGIACFHRAESLECGAGLGYATPFTHAERCLMVSAERAPEARELLAGAAEMEPAPPEEAEGA